MEWINFVTFVFFLFPQMFQAILAEPESILHFRVTKKINPIPKTVIFFCLFVSFPISSLPLIIPD